MSNTRGVRGERVLLPDDRDDGDVVAVATDDGDWRKRWRWRADERLEGESIMVSRRLLHSSVCRQINDPLDPTTS